MNSLPNSWRYVLMLLLLVVVAAAAAAADGDVDVILDSLVDMYAMMFG